MRAVSRRPKVSTAAAIEGGGVSARKRSLRARRGIADEIGSTTEVAIKDESGTRVAAFPAVPYHDIGAPQPRRTAMPSLSAPLPVAEEGVRLIVHGWHTVQPGTLSWVFPTVQAAVLAVHTMRNAVSWAIVRGEDVFDVETARALNAIVLEQG